MKQKIIKQRIIKLIYLLAFIPALCFMYVIFGFSSDNATESSGLSQRISVEVAHQIKYLSWVEWNEDEEIQVAEKIEVPIRKLAHFSEYALMAILWIVPLSNFQKKISKRVMITMIICVLYACTDEFHELFVPGRDGNIKDVCIDSLGALTGCLIVVGFLIIINKCRKVE